MNDYDAQQLFVAFCVSCMIFLVIGILIGLSQTTDCNQEYNRGYGDAIQFTLEEQKFSHSYYNMTVGANNTPFTSHDAINMTVAPENIYWQNRSAFGDYP
jgi:hypothetical protein